MKKALILALSAALTLGSVAPVLAENGNGYDNGQTPAYPTEDLNGYEDIVPITDELDLGEDFTIPALLPVGRTGEITDYNDGRLTVKFGEYDSIILHLQPGTVIIDAVTGSPASIADRESDRVHVYHSPVVMLSFPPQSQALVVAVDAQEDKIPPFYHIVEEVYWVDEDTLRLTVENGGLHLFLTRETPLGPHLTRQLVLLESIKVGDSMIFWYGFVGMSFPGQAYPTNALWIRTAPVYNGYNGENGYDEEYNDYASLLPTTPNVATMTSIAIVRDGVGFYPVRQELYNAGFRFVSWDYDTYTATFTNDTNTVVVTSNSAVFYVNGVSYTLPVATIVEGGRMFAPINFFAHLS